jgi:hypothetical protein
VKRVAGLCAAAIVALSLGLGGRARAQTIEILPAEPPPSRRSPGPAPEAPPEVTPATPPDATPATPPDAPPDAPPEAPAPAPGAAPAAAPPAVAAAFGEAWHYAISLERAVGLDHISQTQSSYGTDSKMTATNVSLFGSPTTGALTAFSFPRAAFDLFLAQDFSVGMALGALYGSTTLTPSSGSSTDQSFTGVLAAPRVGYALHLTPDITLWARGGVSIVYAKVSSDAAYTGETSSSHLVAATIELPFVFNVLPHVALTASPTLDITFNGHLSRPSFAGGAIDEHVTELGIQGGVLLNL